MQEYAQHIARWMLSTFLAVSTRKYIGLYPETVPRNKPKFRRKSMRG